MSMGLSADKSVNNVTRFVKLDTNNIGVTGLFIAAILVEHKKVTNYFCPLCSPYKQRACDNPSHEWE